MKKSVQHGTPIMALVETLGTVHPDGSLELDEKLTVAPGRVKVRLEPLPPSPLHAESLVEFANRTRRELAAAGHHFRTKEEIDRELSELRDDWDGREP